MLNIQVVRKRHGQVAPASPQVPAGSVGAKHCQKFVGCVPLGWESASTQNAFSWYQIRHRTDFLRHVPHSNTEEHLMTPETAILVKSGAEIQTVFPTTG